VTHASSCAAANQGSNVTTAISKLAFSFTPSFTRKNLFASDFQVIDFVVEVFDDFIFYFILTGQMNYNRK
jgi:hypothetical protein